MKYKIINLYIDVSFCNKVVGAIVRLAYCKVFVRNLPLVKLKYIVIEIMISIPQIMKLSDLHQRLRNLILKYSDSNSIINM